MEQSALRPTHAADVPAAALREIAAEFDTPCYAYDARALDEGTRRWLSAVEGPARVWYSVKANANLGLLRRLAAHGIGFEVATPGELARTFAAGVPSDRILYGGVPKRPEDLELALEAGLDLVMLQTRGEVERAVRRPLAEGRARVGVRLRPGVRAGAHPSLETGVVEAKFGLSPEEVPEAWARLAEAPGLSAHALGVHLGSGVDGPGPYLEATDRLLEAVDEAERSATPVRELDLGGGLAVDYGGGPDPEPAALVSAVRDAIAGSGRALPVRWEPGRSIVGRAGLLLTRVLYTRADAHATAVICDAAFSDFGRYVLYGAQHLIEPVDGSPEGEPTVDVLGATCESGDVLGTGRRLHGVSAGDLLVVRDVGAYGFAMASNYNGRARPAEVLVDGERILPLRRRERPDDLWRGEQP